MSILFSKYPADKEIYLRLYKSILTPRIIEEKMLVLLRQGKISKWFSGIGQEAIAVGVTEALQSDEYIFPLHRNLGVFTTRNIKLEKLFAQWQGKKMGFTKGRDRSFHFGTNEHHIAGMISHLGAMMSVANGVVLADLMRKKNKVAAAFIGDGGTSEGEFHEALNVAAVWQLPVIFIVENNGYGLSTPISEQFRCKSLADKGVGYGMKSIKIDGNNILEVFHHIKDIADEIRLRPEPVLVECMTFRRRGHEEASGTKYVPQELMDEWEQRDPVDQFEAFLVDEKILTAAQTKEIRKSIKSEIDAAWKTSEKLDVVVPNTQEELNDLYFPHLPSTEAAPKGGTEIRLVDAVSQAMEQSMEKYPEMVIMGQDVADYGGVFKITEGFIEKFGKERVRNTPLCESAIVGAGLGLSIKGIKSIVEMQFADFVSCGFNQIVNNLAKSHYRWGQNADVVVRMPTGAGVAAGPFHSQSTEAWFVKTPGLKVVYPSNPYDAKGLLNEAIADPNPIMFFEHKKLYRSLKGEVPQEYYRLPIGKANLIKNGQDAVIITYGWGVHWALDYLNENPLDVAVLDLRTLLPWDKEAVESIVKQTGKVLFVQEDTLTAGMASEVCSWIAEHCFQYLDAPVKRVASLDTPVPFVSELEQNFLPIKRMETALKDLLEF